MKMTMFGFAETPSFSNEINRNHLARRLILAWLLALPLCCIPPAQTLASEPAQPDSRIARRSPVVEVFQANKDAVVNISSTHVMRVQSPTGFDALFEDLFDLPRRPREVKQTSVGSGFVLHRQGYIVTNAHVVARTAERKVIFADKREYDAQIVAIDTQHDLAVLKIQPEEALPVIRLGRSDDLMIGETVVAIGNPLGYQHTVTAGVISALDRRIEVGQGLAFTGLLQTDASINPGNSGGPLFNVLGELIGINTAIRGDAQNIGFAIPVDQLRALLPELLDVERRYRLIIGLRVATDTSAAVTHLTPDSPAVKAGIEVGDVVTAIDDTPITNGIDFLIALIDRHEQPLLAITLNRQGRTIQTTLEPQRLPKPDGDLLLQQRLGLRTTELSPENARQLGLPGLRGLIVASVEPGSPAAQAGIDRGDIIERIHRHPASSFDDVGLLLESLPNAHRVEISVLRLQRRMIYRQQLSLPLRDVKDAKPHRSLPTIRS